MTRNERLCFSEDCRTKHQKRLLFLNIKDFCKFCELSTKWVETVSQGGMHSVFVCQYDQIVKLLVSKIPLSAKLFAALNLGNVCCACALNTLEGRN